MLALRRGPVSVSRLVEVLWSDPPENEVNALQRHVSRLRSMLADHVQGDVITYVGGSYELDRRRVTVDIDQLELRAAHRDEVIFAARWWLEPLATVDHVEFVADRRRLEQLCLSARERNIAASDIAGRPKTSAVPVEVVRELRRWLELRPAGDEARQVVEAWLTEVGESMAVLK